MVARTELLDVFRHHGTCVLWQYHLGEIIINITLIQGQSCNRLSYLFSGLMPATDEEHQVILLVRLEHDVRDGLRRYGDTNFEEVESPGVILQRSEDHAAVVEVEQDIFRVRSGCLLRYLDELRLEVFVDDRGRGEASASGEEK